MPPQPETYKIDEISLGILTTVWKKSSSKASSFIRLGEKIFEPSERIILLNKVKGIKGLSISLGLRLL